MGPKFAFPPAVLANHVALVGKTGSGKTSTGKLLVEQEVDAGYRVCILDTVKSDWWGLISSSDGKKPGLPFQILGGPHGHVPLHSGAGKAIGELVGRGDLPLSIIDMADFEAGGLQKFFTGFAPALLKNMRGVLVLVMEEAHEIAPKERVGIGAETHAIYYAKKIATAGRSKGIRLRVLTQRTQALHNALLGSCETLIAHRITKAEDQEPVIKWIRANSGKELSTTIGQQLARIETGMGYMISPEGAAQFRFPKFRTYDNSATPERDGHFEEVVKTAAVDTEKLRQILGDVIKEAEENDPAALKARIKELERKPAAAQVVTHPGAVKEAEARGFTMGIKHAQDELRPLLLKAHTGIDMIGERIASLGFEGESRFSAVHSRTEPSTAGINQAIGAEIRAVTASSSGLPAGERRVLTAIAQYREGVTREHLTVLTGYKKSSRDTYLQKLGARALITTSVAGNIVATEAGLAALGSEWKPLPTGPELRRHWLSPGMLPAGEAKILAAVVEAYPQPVDRGELSARTGYKKSSRDTYIQKLLARQLVTTSEHGVRASSNLFA